MGTEESLRSGGIQLAEREDGLRIKSLLQRFTQGYCLWERAGRSQAEERLLRKELSGTKKFLSFK